ncbi:unnamed protein product [Pylaiella littoralis]
MVRSLQRGVACSMLLVSRAFVEPKALAARWCQLAMLNTTGRIMCRALTLRMEISLRPSSRGVVGVTSRYFLHNKAAHFSLSSFRSSSSDVVDSGESSSLPPPKWNNLYDNSTCPPTAVSLDEYIALGPRYRHQRQQQKDQGQPPATSERTATRIASAFGDDSTSSHREDWLAASSDLAASLGIDPPTSTEAQHRRVFHLYLPIYFWLKQLLFVLHRRRRSVSSSPRDRATTTQPAAAAAAASELQRDDNGVSECGDNSNGRENDRPLVVGISAPQGCGKTTLVSEMQRMLEKAGHSCAVVSIDDFYLTGAEQDDLAARYPTNPLLQVRGNAGTHDLALGLRTIHDLAKGEVDKGDEQGEGGGVVRVPRYDKSARGGKGDRAPEGDWGVVKTPLDIVLLEGWMLGFEALPDDSPLLRVAEEEAKKGEVRALGEVNAFLKDYQELHDEVDAWLVLKTAEPEMVFEWRAEAERRMREAGRPGMSEEQVRDFCSRYMPAYRAYLPGLYESCIRATNAVEAEPGVAGGRARLRSGGEDAEDAANGATTNRRDVARGLRGVEKTLVIEVGRDRNPVL